MELAMKHDDYLILKTMMKKNSWTKNKKGVDEYGQLMTGWLKELGMDLQCFQRSEIGNHLLFSSSHKAQSPTLLLLGHLDTVFPPNTFEEVSEDEEWLYGPGACDMKGGNFVALMALRNIYESLGQVQNIDVLLVSDEETGSDDSKSLLRTIAPNYSACIDFEAAGKNHEVVTARKGIATYTINIEGKAAHAGNHFCDGADANLVAARLLIQLAEQTDLESGTTINVGKINGGIGANTISPHATLTVEARFTSLNEQKRIIDVIPKLVNNYNKDGITLFIDGGLQRDVMVPTSDQAALIDKLSSIIGTPLKTEKRGGVSDANIIAGMGVPTLDGFGPYGDGDHTKHERVSKKSIERRLSEVTKILEYYAS